MNLTACTGLPAAPETRTWYRAIAPIHSATALSSAHTKPVTTRFNPGSLIPASQQFECLYFADSPLVALFEVGSLLGSPVAGGNIPHPLKGHWITLNVQVSLSRVVDLTNIAACQTPLETNAQELTGDWEGYYSMRGPYTPVSAPTGIAPTQELGMSLFNTGIEGFQTISAKVPYQKALVVFPANLASGSSITFTDASGTVVHRVR